MCCSYLQRYKLVVWTNWYSSCKRHISWIGARIIMLRHWSSPGHWTKHVGWRRHHISYENKKRLALFPQNRKKKKKRYKLPKTPGLPQLLSACCLSSQQSLICFPFTTKQLSIYWSSKAPKQTQLHLDDNTIKSTKVMASAFQSAHNVQFPHPQLSQLY